MKSFTVEFTSLWIRGSFSIDFGRFGASKQKKLRKNMIFDFNNIFVTSALRASFWASLEKFDFLAISKSSWYLCEAALNNFNSAGCSGILEFYVLLSGAIN